MKTMATCDIKSTTEIGKFIEEIIIYKFLSIFKVIKRILVAKK